MAITLDNKPATVKGGRRKKRTIVHTFNITQEKTDSLSEQSDTLSEEDCENISSDKRENNSGDFEALEVKGDTIGSETVVNVEALSDQKEGSCERLVVEGLSNGSQSVAGDAMPISDLTALESTDKELPNRLQTVVNTEAIRQSKVESNGSQENQFYRGPLFELVGVQLKILKYLFSTSDKSGITAKMTIDRIFNGTGVNKSSIKAAVLRLKKKKVLNVHFRKNGRGGFVIYKIPNDVFLELLKGESKSPHFH
jgi:hypothetical protein